MRIPRVRAPLLIAVGVALVAGVVDFRASRRQESNWNPRVAQRQQIRWLSAYITAYARDYGRPAFHIDSVISHLDSATAAQFRAYLVDLWGDKIYYRWDEQSFYLMSNAGLSFRRKNYLQDSTNKARIARGDTAWRTHPWAIARHFDIREEYWWPVEARGRKNRLGQFTRNPGLNEPILVRAEPIPREPRVNPPEARRWDRPSSLDAPAPSSPAPQR